MNNLLISIPELSGKIVSFLDTSLGIWYFLILNAFGVIALICKASEFQVKSRKIIFTLATLSVTCWMIYFLLQGDFASSLVSLVGVVQLLIFSQRGKKKWADSILWLIGLLIIQVIFAVMSYKVWFDLFSITAGILTTIAYYVSNRRTYRYLSAILISLWVCNSISKVYVLALINDLIALVSILVAIVRFEILKKTQQQTENN